MDKLIRVYGTLINNTVDNTIGSIHPEDEHQHNDALAYAKQLYDDKFGDSPNENNFQDVINKRIKGIKRQTDTPSATSSTPNKTVIGDDLYVTTGNIYIPDGHGGWTPLTIPDLTSILNRLAALEAMWEISGEYIQPKNLAKKVKGPGFFDSTVD